MVEKVLRIGLLGCGVVGGGLLEVLTKQSMVIVDQEAIHLQAVKVAVVHLERKRRVPIDASRLTTSWQAVCQDETIDVVVEAMGGLEPARTAILTALTHGKHVVTANKGVLAHHGEELRAVAREQGRHLLYEASVLGGVPVLHLLESYYKMNQLQKLTGIVNGTSNYILTQMSETGMSFATALTQAQEAGYAELDPTDDIEGIDAANKLCVLAQLAFGQFVKVDSFYRRGIGHLDTSLIRAAHKEGYVIKLLATLDPGVDGTFVAAVEPVLVPLRHKLASVSLADNALMITSDIVGEVAMTGPGAGALPTASAVVEDIAKLLSQSVSTTTRFKQSLQPVAAVTAPKYHWYLIQGERLSEIRMEQRSEGLGCEAQWVIDEESTAWMYLPVAAASEEIRAAFADVENFHDAHPILALPGENSWFMQVETQYNQTNHQGSRGSDLLRSSSR